MADFSYQNRPIGSVTSLCRLLSLNPEKLLEIANCSDDYYVIARKIPKDDGTFRITYKARYPLRRILDRLNENIFNKVQMPNYILAGRKGQSYIDNALIHKSSKMILSEDIKKFFPSIHQKYITKIFQHLLCFPEEISLILSEICTHEGYLPEGSPVSGVLANLIFFDKEPCLVKYISSLGLTYSRYYDDIYISSKLTIFDEHIGKIRSQLYGMFKSITLSEHSSNNKRRIMVQSARMDIHGVTVNSHKLSPSKKRVSKVRAIFKRLKEQIDNNCEIEKVLLTCRSLQGHIQTLSCQGYERASADKQKLTKLISSINESSAKKYVRKIRQQRSIKSLTKFNRRISTLKKINPRVASVVKAEQKRQREKLKRFEDSPI